MASKVTVQSVIRVREWPATIGERYLVKEIRTVKKSPYPNQVDAWRIERKTGGTYQCATLRTFPLELCEVDEKFTKTYEAHVRRVRARLGE
jgi:hypothetical protein